MFIVSKKVTFALDEEVSQLAICICESPMFVNNYDDSKGQALRTRHDVWSLSRTYNICSMV
ncbi:hypothetical protein CDL12_13373 [Handroanthus impetiginosus]|uniref:Uncharacterized protein n=1 Tax=Handroanthus impetiginosus TaxID=429701 RepID=A0A2G9H902_9LAMI|nr:hypothetical protein CDL12_13373 [Handroanthus impetiginosus]